MNSKQYSGSKRKNQKDINKVNKRYKKNSDSSSDSESETSQEFDTESSENIDSLSSSEQENEYQSCDDCIKDRPKRQCTIQKRKGEKYTDDDEYEKTLDEEYENYLQEINELEKKETIKHIFIINPPSQNEPKPPSETNIEHLTEKDKKKIEDAEKALYEMKLQKIPPRNKILLTDLPISSKEKIIDNMERYNMMNSHSSEYSKLSKWLNNILKVPFGVYCNIPVTISSSNKEISEYLNNIQTTMDKCIYGQTMAKEKILEFVGKWITNPNTTNEPLAFIGEKGTGKTTLAKEGISKALGRPFYMISLGGESDSSSFKGHDYTYEGSTWGKIVDILISTKCMNPVIFFDELDKVSSTRYGEEIIGMLMHLTDTTQNDTFTDKYFSGIEFDLSKALFIFSYNDPHKINPILRDRLTEVKFNPFNKKDKMIIAKDFLIKRECENIGLSYGDYLFSDNIISILIERYTSNEDSGVRNLKRVIETLLLRLNLYNLPQKLNISYKNIIIKIKDGKYRITENVVSEILKDIVPKMSDCVLSMYL